MARHFPIFIELGTSLPLVVGADPALAAKLRQLRGFAPLVDLITFHDKMQAGLGLSGVHHITGISYEGACHHFTGRSLVMIKTGDRAPDESPSRQARRIGVQVNVPEEHALCSFYLGSIVDRDPVTLAVLTGGYAAVLAQRLRARIEDWLPVGYGRVAAYLNRIRQRLHALPAARRRLLQHRIIDGEAASWILEGDEPRADSFVVEMLADQPVRGCGGLHVIDAAAGEPAQLCQRQIAAARRPDFQAVR